MNQIHNETDSQSPGRIDPFEAESLEELFGDTPSARFDREALDCFVKARFDKEIEANFKLMQKEKELSIKERQSAMFTNNALTGVMVLWSVIGAVMLGRSCINTDPGPKFKV